MTLCFDGSSNSERDTVAVFFTLLKRVHPTAQACSSHRSSVFIPPRKPVQVLIKQAVYALIRQLESGKSDALTACLNAMARFHLYSLGNILQIARQRPSGNRVAGIRRWNEMGRFVKPSENGIQILAPMVGDRRNRQREQGNVQQDKPSTVLIDFRPVYVLDVLSRDLWPRVHALYATRNSSQDASGEVHHRSIPWLSAMLPDPRMTLSINPRYCTPLDILAI